MFKLKEEQLKIITCENFSKEMTAKESAIITRVLICLAQGVVDLLQLSFKSLELYFNVNV